MLLLIDFLLFTWDHDLLSSFINNPIYGWSSENKERETENGKNVESSSMHKAPLFIFNN